VTSQRDPILDLPRLPAFHLKSSDFTENGTLSMRHVLNGFGYDGENVSPELSWSEAPAETKSYVLACFDPDAPTMSGFWHWMAIDIPASVTHLEGGTGRPGGLPAGRQLRNDLGSAGYDGPAPPPGPPHRYMFILHALDVESLEVPGDATPTLAMFLTGSHALARAVTIGRFGQP
jgi:Raf kinase inhibitor-like YbhB/YbcL family protein